MYRINPIIEGWMLDEELQWLYEQSKRMTSVVEVGSWMGKSTFALALGLRRGLVYAVDQWKWDEDNEDYECLTGIEVYQIFLQNMRRFSNIVPIRATSKDAAAMLPDNIVDMVFIDATHTYEEVKADIALWMPKTRKLICGHDYCAETYPGVIQAVDELLPGAGVVGTIWYKWLEGK